MSVDVAHVLQFLFQVFFVVLDDAERVDPNVCVAQPPRGIDSVLECSREIVGGNPSSMLVDVLLKRNELFPWAPTVAQSNIRFPS
jgi:hypothetical protein